jgi:type I restriction enzyme R subunit
LNEFCQKITSKAKKPEELLQQFRTGYQPRIAVTIDMIATGTDVKPLECLHFMRDVRSAGYFEQMKGRGCRIIDSDQFQQVTSDAKHKTRFVIVDAVGVCHSDKTTSKPLDRKPTVSLEKLLETFKTGAVDADVVSTLAASASTNRTPTCHSLTTGRPLPIPEAMRYTYVMVPGTGNAPNRERRLHDTCRACRQARAS